jgi:hypothetical protein
MQRLMLMLIPVLPKIPFVAWYSIGILILLTIITIFPNEDLRVAAVTTVIVPFIMKWPLTASWAITITTTIIIAAAVPSPKMPLYYPGDDRPWN